MPLNKLLLLLFVVIVAAAGTVWLVTSVWGQAFLAENWFIALPVVLVVYLAVRFLSLHARR